MTEPDSELDQFLHEESSEGLLRSHGEFTLDAAKARAKLGHFALPEPGLWVVKIVQSAVASGASQIDFKFLKRKVEVRFENAGKWQAGDVLKQLLSASVPRDRALMHLQAGLLAAAAGQSQSLIWSCGEHKVELDDSGHRLESNAQPTMVLITATRPTEPESKPSRWTSPLRYLFRQTAHEFKALVDRCRCCPIPIKIDGYELERHYGVRVTSLPTIPNYDSDSSTGRNQLFCLKPLSCFTERETLLFPLAEKDVSTELQRFEEKEEFSPTALRPTEDGVNGVLNIYSALQRESRVNFLLDGALITSQLLYREQTQGLVVALRDSLENGEENLVIDLYLNTKADCVDLTHFQVKEEELESLVHCFLPELIQTLTEIQANCHKPWNFQIIRFSKPQVLNASLSDILTTGFLTPFIPHLVVIGGVVTIASPLYKIAKPYFDSKKAESLKKRLETAILLLKELQGNALIYSKSCL